MTPTEPRSLYRISQADYARRARELDRNFSVAEWSHDGTVLLRLDFPGAGLADGYSPEFLASAQRYFDSIFGRSRAKQRLDWFTVVSVLALALLATLLMATPAQ